MIQEAKSNYKLRAVVTDGEITISGDAAGLEFLASVCRTVVGKEEVVRAQIADVFALGTAPALVQGTRLSHVGLAPM